MQKSCLLESVVNCKKKGNFQIRPKHCKVLLCICQSWRQITWNRWKNHLTTQSGHVVIPFDLLRSGIPEIYQTKAKWRLSCFLKKGWAFVPNVRSHLAKPNILRGTWKPTQEKGISLASNAGVSILRYISISIMI